MEIRLEYVAMLKVNAPPSGGVKSVREGDTIATLLEQIGIPANQRGVITPFVNEAKVSQNYTLQDGDRVFLAMPIGGG